MTGLGIVVALVAGFVSFASPCCLPMVPVYVSYMVGSTPLEAPDRRAIALRQSLAFVAGFTVVFVTLWASVGIVGYLVRDHIDVLRMVGGVVLIVMGLHVAQLIEIPSLRREVRLPAGRVLGIGTATAPAGGSATGTATVVRTVSYRRSALLGVVFAAGWTPCVGPILGGIIGLASVSQSVGQGTLLLLAYATGLAIPFVLVAIGADAMAQRLSWIRNHNGVVSLVTGGMLILIGFLMVTDLLARASSLLPSIGL
jgi:cytochrome c-type biogenesis protein